MTAPDVRVSLLLAATHTATEKLPADRSAAALYEQASLVAERTMPGPVGTALAAVLVLAADRRRASRLNGSLGESRSLLALALAVIEAGS